MEEQPLMKMLVQQLKNKGYTNIFSIEDFIIAEGNIPICLLAHCDTVFPSIPSEWIYDQKKEILWSPSGAGFDDRAGIYAILKILENGFRPCIIFTTGEEMGGIGAHKLIHFFPSNPFTDLDIKFLIQLDRMGKNDCVFYDCNNRSFIKKIESYGFRKNQGTYTDISIIAPQWGVAAVNLSVGYYDEHTYTERLYLKHLRNTIKKVENILTDANDLPKYKYIKNKNMLLDSNFLFKNSKNQEQKENLIEEDEGDTICFWCNKKISLEKADWLYLKEENIKVPICENCSLFNI